MEQKKFHVSPSHLKVNFLHVFRFVNIVFGSTLGEKRKDLKNHSMTPVKSSVVLPLSTSTSPSSEKFAKDVNYLFTYLHKKKKK